MTYKLLIKANVKHDSEYSKILGVREFPTSTTLNVSFDVTNIGDKNFPGGILETVGIEYAESAGGLYLFRNPKKQFNSIAKDQTQTIFSWSVTLIRSGLAWFQCQIKATDSQPIKFFQIPENEGGVGTDDDWKNYYSIIDKHQLEIVSLLQDINTKLDK